MNRIRGDKLLWQAHTSNSEFFSVSVKVGATLDYKTTTPSLEQTHFYLPNKDSNTFGSQKVKMGLGNMVAIKLD